MTSHSWIRVVRSGAIIALLAVASACSVSAPTTTERSGASRTAADAKAFLDRVNDGALRLGIAQGQAGWVQQTYITDDTDAIAARSNQRYIDAI
ncbi:MAG TPA: hypothetical protein VG222_14595, partial [Vicinamibacterales bacterium]|nr:hypothetical protein [Vicinamibacterales bacterium]